MRRIPATPRPSRPDSGLVRFWTGFGLDVIAPLAVFYGLRAAGVNQWWALVLGAVLPLVRIIVTVLAERKIERLGLFTLTVLGTGTGIGLLTADPRLLLARESYLTALVGLWILSTLLAHRPMIYTATTQFMPPAAAAQWDRDWQNQPKFRITLRVMTLAWALAFLLDAAARVVMAYTLPVDLVPIASTVLLVLLLVLIVQASKSYGKRHLPSPRNEPLRDPQET